MLKKYFVIFIIENEDGKNVFKNDTVEFEEIKRLHPIRKLEEHLLGKWGDSNKEYVTIINYEEV